jgi:hypothetical protein
VELDQSSPERRVTITQCIGTYFRASHPLVQTIAAFTLLTSTVTCIAVLVTWCLGFPFGFIWWLMKWTILLTPLISISCILILTLVVWVSERVFPSMASGGITLANRVFLVLVIAGIGTWLTKEKDLHQIPRMTAKPDRRPSFGNQIQSNQAPPPIPKNQVDVAHGDATSETKAAVTELYWAEIYLPFFHVAFIKLPTVADNWEIMRVGLLEELDGIEQMASHTRFVDADPDLVSMVSSQIDWQRQTANEVTDILRMVEELNKVETPSLSEDNATPAPVGDVTTQKAISQEEFEKNTQILWDKVNRYIDDPNVFPENKRPVADRFVGVLYEQNDRLYEATTMQVRMQERYQGRAFDLPPIPTEEEDIDTN